MTLLTILKDDGWPVLVGPEDSDRTAAEFCGSCRGDVAGARKDALEYIAWKNGQLLLKQRDTNMKTKIPVLHPLAAVAVAAFIIGCSGCKTVPVIVPPIAGLAACELVRAKPASAQYVNAIGVTFTVFGKGVAPTPAELQVALGKVTGANVTPTEARAIWVGAVLVYDGLYSAAKTPEDKQALSALLTDTGSALAGAVNDCGPKGIAAPSIWLLAERPEVESLAAAVEKQFKAKAKKP